MSKKNRRRNQKKNDGVKQSLSDLWVHHRDVILPPLMGQSHFHLITEMEYHGKIENNKCCIYQTVCWIGSRAHGNYFTIIHYGANRDIVSSFLDVDLKRRLTMCDSKEFKLGFSTDPEVRPSGSSWNTAIEKTLDDKDLDLMLPGRN